MDAYKGYLLSEGLAVALLGRLNNGAFLVACAKIRGAKIIAVLKILNNAGRQLVKFREKCTPIYYGGPLRAKVASSVQAFRELFSAERTHTYPLKGVV